MNLHSIKNRNQMKKEVEYPKVSLIALALLSHLFYDAILALEQKLKNSIVLEKQLSVKKVQKEIEKLIMRNPYSFFEICVLEENCDDPENSVIRLTIKNFKHFMVNPEIDPLYYRIVINNTWSGFDVYQKSLSGILIKSKL